MKSASFLFSLLLIASSSFGGWSSSGPTGGAVNMVVVAPSDPAVIWACSSGGVFRSTDGGATWSNVSGPLTTVARIAVHPNDPNKAWALSAPLGLYRTVDGGATWISSNRFAGITPTALLNDPRDPDTLYVSGNCYVGFDVAFLPWMGVHKSTDGGLTWTTLGPDGFLQCVQELAIDPFSPWRLFLGGAYGSNSESYDAAKGWEGSAQGTRPTRDVLIDPRYPFTHYGISSQFNSFFVSQDGGFTWSGVATKPPAQVRSLTIDPERGRLFLGTVNGLFRSGNSGRVWATTQLPDSDVSALDFGGTSPAVFAATNQGLYQVVNRGQGEPRLIDLHDIATKILAMDVDPSDPNIVYASTTDTVFGSTPTHGGVFSSTNGGASWQRVPGDIDVEIGAISIDAAGTVYAATNFRGSGLYRRKRGETQWTKIRPIAVGSLAADPKTPGRVFLTGSFGLERSVDGGDHWQYLPAYGSIVLDPSDPRWLYLFSGNSLYRSSDGGDTWSNLQLSSATHGLAVAPSNGKVLYRTSAQANAGVRPERSDDRGETWHAATLPQDSSPSSLTVDPNDENSVWATGAGLYHSADGGANWSEVKGPKGEHVGAIALRFDPTGRVLHVAYPGHGVWELTFD